ncbi:MAG: ROK family transcriptional regulator [Ignavibacteriales bacterium]
MEFRDLGNEKSMNDENLITGNAKVVRSINRAMILNIIRTKQPIPRTEIAKITGLNKSTVSSIVNDLLQEELINEQVKSDQNVGRNPVDLYLRKNKYLTGAINIDVAKTRMAIVDIDGSIIDTSVISTDPGNPEKFIKSCLREVRNLCKRMKIDQLEGLGINIAGIVDSRNCIVNYAPNLGWEDFNIGKVIRKSWPELKVLVIGNDAKSSALAELWFGAYEVNLSNFVSVSVGSGIGSGIVVENKLLDGEFQASGEFGHITIIEGGELCSCGNNGCWEKYASDRATVKRYTERKTLKGATSQNEVISIETIIASALSNDSPALEVLKETGYYLGLGITNIIRSIDPQAVILSGKITQAWDIIYPEIIKVVRERAFFGKERNILILLSSLGDRSRLLGAATLVIKEIFDCYRITTE